MIMNIYNNLIEDYATDLFQLTFKHRIFAINAPNTQWQK